MDLLKQINEAVHVDELSSGFQRAPRSVEKARSVAAGEEAVELTDGKTYRAKKNGVPGKSLKKGDIVLARYNTFNQGVDICKVLGVTDDKKQYGVGGVKFESVAQCLRYFRVKTLPQLEELQNKNEYGYESYLVVEDMEGVEGSRSKRGPWYYLHQGRWVRGSGAEKLSFTLMEEVEEDEVDNDDQQRRMSGFSGE